MKKINHKQRAHKKLLLVAIFSILLTFTFTAITPVSTFAKVKCTTAKWGYYQSCINTKTKTCKIKKTNKKPGGSKTQVNRMNTDKKAAKQSCNEYKQQQANAIGNAISDAVSSVVGTTTTAVNDATNNVSGNNSGTSGTTTSTTTTTTKPPTFTGQCDYFLGLTSWSCGVDISDQASLKNGIWQIVANVAADITVIAAYLILGFVIYGGYLYMFSAGDSGKVEKGKKTLTHAFIGLAIVLLANAIMSTIRYILGGRLDGLNNTDPAFPEAIVSNAINWFIGIAGLVSVIFIVYGGISYMTSRGDPGKIQKAKHTILYALIGLAIVALSIAISAFVSSTIDNAKKASQINQTTISKEVYENNQII